MSQIICHLFLLETTWWDAAAADQPCQDTRQDGSIFCRKSHPAPFEMCSEVSGWISANVVVSGLGKEKVGAEMPLNSRCEPLIGAWVPCSPFHVALLWKEVH